MSLKLSQVHVFLYFASILSVSMGFAEDARESKIDKGWDSLFVRKDGWTGGDVAGTIDLNDGRVLWIFGDTWIGPVVDGKHAAGSQMVNNTAAIHRRSDVGASIPPESIEFLFGNDPKTQKATAWIVPANPSDEAEPTWFWPTGGGVTVVQNGRPSLYVFLFKVQKAGVEGVWNFRIAGTTMAVFDDIRLSTDEWQARLLDIPHSIGTPKGATSEFKTSEWGLTALVEPAAGGEEVFIYGVKRRAKDRDNLVLAKVPAARIEQFDQWSFYAGPDKWSPLPGDAVSVAENLPKELSVERSRSGSEFLMVHSEPMLGTGIFLRRAKRPEGPWSARELIHRVSDYQGDRRFFTYAAKGHVLLSGVDNLLVTYAVNAHEFGLIVEDANVYRPHCIRVKLAP